MMRAESTTVTVAADAEHIGRTFGFLDYGPTEAEAHAGNKTGDDVASLIGRHL